jgi:CDGSH-type Zn-finger protein
MASKGRIKITKDGPYIITGGIPLVRMVIEVDLNGYPYRWREVERYPSRESYALCRCGRSKTKPYCDGAHIKTKFNGSETAKRKPYLDNTKEFIGPNLKLTDYKLLCVGAGFCDRAGNIWNLTVNSDTPDYRMTAIEEAGNCPSGRLVVWDKKDSSIEPDYKPSIAVTEDQDGVPGPLWVRGGVEIEAADGYVYETRNRVTLCGCGRSMNKPFCDGSHLDD